MTNEQEIRSEALEQATRVSVCEAKRWDTAVDIGSLLELADKFSDYIKTGDHR